ncbi:MAG: Loki-CTERM sorting domain-containing protein [Candidatus Hermodarchaeota archaeon]
MALPSADPPTMPISSRGLTTTGPVAILEDADPWGFNDVEDILLTYPHMTVTTIPSASFGGPISQYQKVIISSDQVPAFYTALETYQGWLENYVTNGGVLEIHAARSSAQGDYFLPGGFGYTVNLTSNVEFVDVNHYLLHNPNEANETELDGWTFSAHGYLNNTGAATVIITDGAEPVLIETRYGLGYIIVTTQTIEFISGNGYTDFLENLVWYVPTHESPLDGALTGPIGLLQDTNPWGHTCIQQVLDDLGITYDIIPSADFGTVNLAPYQKVIVSSVQSASFYTYLQGNRTWLESYVNNGGILEIHAATQGWDWILPFGAGYNHNFNDLIETVYPLHRILYHPYLILATELDYWYWSSHGYFNDTMGATHLIEDGLEAVCFENASGNGFVIATAQTVEWAWHNNYSMFLENLIRYVPQRLVQLHPGDYIDTYWDTAGGDYYKFNFTCVGTLNYWDVNMTHSVQRYHSDDTLYEDLLYWMNLHRNTRISDAGTSWWSWGNYFTLMIPNTGLTIGSVIPLWSQHGIIVGDVGHVWINGITYDCWNVSWWDGMTPSYSYFEKSSGVLLFFSNPSYDVHTTATNLVVQPPTVTVTYPNGGEILNGTKTITWDAFDINDDALTFDIHYWDGSTWIALAMGHTTTSLAWDTTTVPNGADYRIRVTVHDGLFTEVDESNAIFTIDNPVILPPPPIPGFPIEAIVLGAIIALSIGIIYRRRKR